MANAREWIAGARPRTLPIIIAPVVAGAAVAWFGAPDTKQVALRASALFAFVLCLLVGVGIQIGCNLANDYSDGVRGTDARRVGRAGALSHGPHMQPRARLRVEHPCGDAQRDGQVGQGVQREQQLSQEGDAAEDRDIHVGQLAPHRGGNLRRAAQRVGHLVAQHHGYADAEGGQRQPRDILVGAHAHREECVQRRAQRRGGAHPHNTRHIFRA